MKFKEIDYKTIPEEKTLWLYNEHTKFLALGAFVYLENEGWFFACQDNGLTWVEDGEIQIEGYIDDWDFTHYLEVPAVEV